MNIRHSRWVFPGSTRQANKPPTSIDPFSDEATITGDLKGSSPVLNDKPVDLSKEEYPFPITESDDQVPGSCPDSPLDAENFLLFNPGTDSAKFTSAIEAASRGIVANPCSPLKNVLSFSDKKKAPSRRVSSAKPSLFRKLSSGINPSPAKPSTLTSLTAAKPASPKPSKKSFQRGSPSTGVTSRIANLERGVLQLRRAVGVPSDDSTGGTTVPLRLGALEARVDKIVLAVNANTRSTAASKIRVSALFQKLN